MDKGIAQKMKDVNDDFEKAIAVLKKNMDEKLLDIKNKMGVALEDIHNNLDKIRKQVIQPFLGDLSDIEKKIGESRERFEEHMKKIDTNFINTKVEVQTEMAEKYMKITSTGAPPTKTADIGEDAQIEPTKSHPVVKCKTVDIKSDDKATLADEPKGTNTEGAKALVEKPSKRTDAGKDIQSKPTEIGEGSKTVESQGGAKSKMVDKQKGMKSESAVPQVGIPIKKTGVEEDTGNKSTGIRAEIKPVGPQTGARSKIPDNKRGKHGRR